MKIKRYLANTAQEAMIKVKQELGSQAVILHERKIKRKGLLGRFKKPFVELVVAIDEGGSKQTKNVDSSDTLRKEIEFNNMVRKEKDQLNREIKELRDSINNMMMFVRKGSAKDQLPKELTQYYTNMLQKGVDEDIAFDILDKINTRIDINDKTSEEVRHFVAHEIKEYIGEAKPIELNNQIKTIFFVGPTGVGKTTTIAKIAADFAFNNNKRVGVISADTYRIAAVEQIKTYCEIMNLPLKVAYKKEDIYDALSAFKDKDIVFVDTAGRSHKDTEQIENTFELLSSVKNKEVYLVLSATTDYGTIKSIIKTYKDFPEYKIIFTKLDECEKPGLLLNVKYWTDRSLSYITTGQNVPEDIDVADVTSIVKEMIGG